MLPQQYIALIGDLVSSREVSKEARHRLQDALTWLLDSTPARWESGFKAPPQVTLGDEFQVLFHADTVGVQEMLIMITQVLEMARPTEVRFGIGVGSLSTSPKPRALGMDGPCFHRAREALSRARSAGLPCQLVVEGEATDELWGTLASYALRQRQDWTGPQREAITRRSRLESWKEVADSLGITPGAVSMRQRTAEWPLYSMAWSALERGLVQLIGESSRRTVSNHWFNVLKNYPLASICFEAYLSRIADRDDLINEHNDLISALQAPDHERLDRLEKLLVASRDVLHLKDGQFRDAFFGKNLGTANSEMIHDALAEPLFVLDLADLGFSDIKKLKSNTKGDRKPTADFTAQRAGKKYAIELKSIRPEDKPTPQPGKPAGNASIPYWWGEMLRSNIRTKIEAKERSALAQLENTKDIHDCDETVLAIYTRRLGPSTLMNLEDYERELATVKGEYAIIDHLIIKDYFGRIVVHPSLDE